MSVQYVQGMDVEGGVNLHRGGCELADRATGPLNRTLMPPVATSWRNSKRPRSLWHSGRAVNLLSPPADPSVKPLK